LAFIATLKAEVETQRRLLGDRRGQNKDLQVELSRTEDLVEGRRSENARLRGDLAAQSDLSESLGRQKRQLQEENAGLRERNGADQAELQRLGQV
jgi:protein required for attachment to host cells